MMGRPHAVRHASRHLHTTVMTTLAVIVAAVAGFMVIFGLTLTTLLGGAVDTRDAGALVTAPPPPPAQDGGSEPLNILLIGSDSRHGDNAAFGLEGLDGMRSDATVIAHVSGDRSRVDLVSIPRDLQVDIPDCTFYDGSVQPGGHGSFFLAFANGGTRGDPAEAAACAINAVHKNTGIRIDHWAVVDFTGFTRMVDSLGGIPMCIPEPIVSAKAGLDLEAGPQLLNGQQALGFARLRTAEVGDVSGSDLQRINRQQLLLEQTVRAAFAKNLFTDADELTSFMRAGAESLTTDPALGSIDFLARLAYSLRDLSSADFTFTTVPWEYTEDRLDVLPTAQAEQLFDDIRHDRPLTVTAEDDATSEWSPGEPGQDSDYEDPSPTTPSPASEPDTIEGILATC